MDPHLRKLRFTRLLTEGRWERDVEMHIDAAGTIVSLQPFGRGPAEHIGGWAIPGVPNLHSHSFQRALVGLAEGGGKESFWRWRDVMYAFLRHLTPDDVEQIAAQLYVELLKAGFTSVGEFHYLHHPPSGAYDDEGEVSRRIFAAARRAEIGLVHLPVLYEHGGFGGAPLEGSQRQFRLDLGGLLRLRESLEVEVDRPNFRVGWGIHSLRAVGPASLRSAVAHMPGEIGPVHIHVAEQEREVEECLADRGARPVEWLLANAPVDGSWCLVHATHLSDAELEGVVSRGPVVGLCPSTEANLGDGLFRVSDFVAGGGTFGIGTDSHVSRSPAEELRLLDYGRRLVTHRRGFPGEGSTGPATEGAASGAGGRLMARARVGGARALGMPTGGLARGGRADLVVLDPDHPVLVGRSGPSVLDTWVFGGGENPVAHVLVGGEWVVRDGQHIREEQIREAFTTTTRRLAARL